MDALSVSGTIAVGDLLTVVTILLSVVALMSAWHRDRQTREREIADRVRRAAAATLAKFERWDELTAAYYYRDVHPAFIAATDQLAASFDVDVARDVLWRDLMARRITAVQRILDEGVESAYIDLYAYYPELHDPIASAVAALRRADEIVYARFLEDTQSVIRAVDASTFRRSLVGNALRAVAGRARAELAKATADIIGPVRDGLRAMVDAPDPVLIDRSGTFSVDDHASTRAR